MRKHNNLVKFLKKVNLTVNSLLEKYLNRLKFLNLRNIGKSNKVLLIFVILIIFFLSYLSIPHAYNKTAIKKELENQILDKFGLHLIASKNYKYKFFPRPQFILEDASIMENQKKISNIKKLNIFVSLNNLFSLNNVSIKEIIIEDANFNLDKNNYNFFIKFLDNNFLDSSFKIINSNIFYKNLDSEVLFINKIIKMNYYYDSKELKNILLSENEIFNMLYSFSSFKKNKKKVVSKIDLDFLNLQIENELDLRGNLKKGSAIITYNQKKSSVHYELKKDSFILDFFDKLKKSNFSYKAIVSVNPFFSNIVGKAEKVDLSFLFNSNFIFFQLLKTELLHHKNLNIDLSINAKKIQQYKNFINIFLNLKIQEGLIDIDNTKFSWKNYADLNFSDTLIYINDNELILDGKLTINIIDLDKIYKFMLTPRKNRSKIKTINLNINYNFDKKIMNFKDIKIDDQINPNINKILKSLIFKNNHLQNKIYLKNAFNEAAKGYAG